MLIRRWEEKVYFAGLHYFYFPLLCLPQGEYGQGVKDCDSALNVCKESRRALYRKALCLKELGEYKEAYSCTTNCLLITRLVREGDKWMSIDPTLRSTVKCINYQMTFCIDVNVPFGVNPNLFDLMITV